MLAGLGNVGRVGLPITRAGGGLRAIAANAGPGSWWYDVSDTATVFRGPGHTNPVTADGQAVVALADKSGKGNHATLTGTYKTDGTLHWIELNPAVPDFLVTPQVTPNANCILALAIEITSTAAIIRAEEADSSSYFFVSKQGNAVTGIYPGASRIDPNPTLRADGVLQAMPATRGEAYDVLAANKAFLWEAFQYKVGFTGGNGLLLGYTAATYEFGGKFFGAMELYRGSLTPEERALIEAEMFAKAGVA